MMNRLKRILRPLSSLRLTVVTLSAALVLVFAGTLAQVKFGLYAVQEQYFQSWFIWWTAESGEWKIPVYPGGHLLGAVLLVNLIASHISRFTWKWKKLGIQLTHLGLIIMLAGGLATDLFSTWSYMSLREGETKDYSEDEMNVELALVDLSNPDAQSVVAIPQGRLVEGERIAHESLPFDIQVLQSYGNSSLSMVAHGSGREPASTQGIGSRIAVEALPPATRTDELDVPSAVLELIGADGESLGSWLVSRGLSAAQEMEVDGKTWSLQIRSVRYYKPYSLTLVDFTKETYPGTNIPKDFSSTVMVNDELNDEHRQVRIYMNHPLRYGGETYYQSGNPDSQTTILRVVRNPSYQAPYIACVIMSIGLIFQFTYHLIGFTRRSRKATLS